MTRRRGGDEPTPLDALLAAVAADLGSAPPADINLLVDGWTQILGTQLADGLVPNALVDGVLTVVVADPARRAQLRFEAPEIQAKVNEFFDRDLVRDVRAIAAKRP